ncbi:MAG: anti-sigma factor [Bacteroidota bacterium]
MDRNSIKEDGILEQYLLGELNREQRAEVHSILQEDPELKKHFSTMEADFERLAMENAIAPHPRVKESLEKALAKAETPPTQDSKVVPLKNNKRSYFYAAASLAAIFLLSSFWLYNQWQSSEENLQVLQNKTSDLQERLVTLEKNYEETNGRYQTINNPNVIPLLLTGNQVLPGSRAVAYVNHRTKQVVLNPQGLPALESDKTYQMWADVDGVMINMGVVPIDEELISLKYIDKAESLNITIEPAGGNDHPTVENLISNVYL